MSERIIFLYVNQYLRDYPLFGAYSPEGKAVNYKRIISLEKYFVGQEAVRHIFYRAWD